MLTDQANQRHFGTPAIRSKSYWHTMYYYKTAVFRLDIIDNNNTRLLLIIRAIDISFETKWFVFQ